MRKGRIAEDLVFRVFVESGVPIMQMGYEHHFLGFIKANIVEQSLSYLPLKRIRSMPDFLISNTLGEGETIEIKLRRNGKFFKDKQNDNDDIKILESLNEFWTPTKIILVAYNFETIDIIVVPPPYNLDSDGYPLESHSILEEPWGIQKKILESNKEWAYKKLMALLDEQQTSILIINQKPL